MDKVKMIFSVTTYNRGDYLRSLLTSWEETHSKDIEWKIVIADDGSNDNTLSIIQEFEKKYDVFYIQNNRVGVHQQTNEILKYCAELDFDFAFKVDDDVKFLKPGWDKLYLNAARETGYHHLIFQDSSWNTAEISDRKVNKHNLVSITKTLNAHGFLYTFSPEVIKKVGYIDVDTFGFRGMGHVDYTYRCGCAGFNDKHTPFDVDNSNEYVTSSKKNYNSSINQSLINIFDRYHRERKEKAILERTDYYVPYSKNELINYKNFKEECLAAFIHEYEKFEQEINEKNETILWYDKELEKIKEWSHSEIEKTKNYYEQKIKRVPKWIFSIFKI